MATHDTSKNTSSDEIHAKESAVSQAAEVEAQNVDFDPKMDARLRRKIDTFIIPVFGVSFPHTWKPVS